MQDISIIDETFDVNISSSYFLSIQLSLDGFCFCTLDPIRNKYIQYTYKNWNDVATNSAVSLDDFLPQFESYFQSNDILTLIFKKVFVLVNSADFLVVPNVLFAKERIESLFQLSHTKRDDEVLLQNRVKLIDSTIIYPLSQKWKESLQVKFDNVQIFHEHASTLEALSLFNRSSKIKNNITLCFGTKAFDVFAFSNSNLILTNHFEFTNDTDFLYYFLFVFEQLKFTNDDSELFIIGNIEANSPLILSLKQYIKRVSFRQISKSLTFSYLFKDIPQYSNFSLYNIPLCVS